MMRATLVTLSALALVAITAALASCTEGTTPDCATVNCGPDLDGSGPADTGAKDGASDSAADAGDGGDAADAASDAPTDAPKDAPPG